MTQHPIETAYRQYGDFVLRRARLLLGNEADAHEVVQDVFSRWWARPRLFAGRSRVSTWLYVVTTRECLQRLRRDRRRTGLLEQACSSRDDGDGQLDPETRALLVQILDTLPEAEAMMLIHHHIDGMTHAEIARGLGKTRRRVGQILESARRRVAALTVPGARHESPGTSRSAAPDDVPSPVPLPKIKNVHGTTT